MIGGIFENIGKTLSGGEKYFLELDDSAGTDAAPVEDPASKSEKAAVPEVKAAAAAPAEKVEKPAAESKAPAKDTPAKPEAPSSASKQVAPAPDKPAESKKKSKSKKKKKQAAKTSAKPKADKAVAQSAQSDATPPAAAESSEPKVPTATDLIVNAIAAAGPIPMENPVADGDEENVPAQTFSTDYLLPLDNQSPRRPGPALGNFRVMAKSVTKRTSL
ncbi:MAG: hypothetical protein AAGC93_17455 [Cyanobacteria bacterium P01_F01_bin.53]